MSCSVSGAEGATEPEPTVFSSELFAQGIACQALPCWQGLQGARVEPVKVRENAVFRVTTVAGSSYALRIHRPGYHSDQSLTSEYAWIEALRASGIDTPRIVASAAGSPLASVHHQGTRYQLDLFEWVEADRPSVELGGAGSPASEILSQYRSIGQTMGRMHSLSASWTVPAGFTRHSWDAEGLVGDAPFWGQFWCLAELSVPQRSLMLELRDKLRVELGSLEHRREVYGMIHSDLMPDNVVITPGGPCVIDFDDAGFGWYMFDIAVSLFSFSARQDFPAVRDAFVEGYQSSRVISQSELASLPLFLAARGATLLGWLHSRRQQEAAQRTPWLIDLACRNAQAWLSERTD